MQKKPQLHLLPNTLSDEETNIAAYFPKSVMEAVVLLDGLIAESEKGGRYFLKKFSFPEGKTFRDVQIRTLSEHTKEGEFAELLAPIKEGQVWGLISDAGLPCLADPGAKLVYLARQLGIDIKAHIGPSSIILALMLSGLHAQKFTFEGYLPKESLELVAYIKQMQQRAQKESSSHVFIETPYRVQQMIERLIETLDERMKLSISLDLTMPSQEVLTKTVKEWKKLPRREWGKRLAVFVVSA